MTAVATSVPTVTQRLDRLPATRFHIVWITVLGLAYLLESFDNVVFSYIAPSVQADWKLSLGQVGLVSSAVFIGMFFGAIGGGRASDRLGRKPLIVWGSVLYGLASIYSALSPDFINLFISRIIAGIGVEAGTGVMLVYIAETFPRKSRGRFVSVLILISTFSAPLTSFAALAIAPRGLEAWRWVFAIGFLGAIVGLVIALVIPETVRWLNTHGQTDQAEKVVDRLENSVTRNGRVLPPAETAHIPTVKDSSLRELLDPRYLKRLVATALIFGMFVFALYGWITWVPTVLVHNGMTQVEALQITSVISLFSFGAPILLFFISDRIQRKTAIFIECGLGGIAMIVFGYMHSPVTIIIVGAIVLIAVTAGTGSFYTYIPEIFPTEVRGVGAGTVNAIGRVAGVLEGILVGVIVGALGSINLYIILGVMWLVVAVSILILGRRTSRMSVEESGAA
ncbi:MAG: putative major facilitator superfamily transporter [Frondihabitans sp.]|nr:putative major facilitator superfamily transporter [Frondihabitans sp.]